jgi:hypothetical protein
VSDTPTTPDLLTCDGEALVTAMLAHENPSAIQSWAVIRDRIVEQATAQHAAALREAVRQAKCEALREARTERDQFIDSWGEVVDRLIAKYAKPAPRA